MMTKEQAFEICETAEGYYNFKLTQQQLKLWIDLLEKRGDYERSKKKLEDRILSGNQYTPVLPEIIALPYKQNIKTHKETHEMDEETRKKLKKSIENFDEQAKNGELTLDDL